MTHLLNIILIHFQNRPIMFQPDFHFPLWNASLLRLQLGRCRNTDLLRGSAARCTLSHFSCLVLCIEINFSWNTPHLQAGTVSGLGVGHSGVHIYRESEISCNLRNCQIRLLMWYIIPLKSYAVFFFLSETFPLVFITDRQTIFHIKPFARLEARIVLTRRWSSVVVPETGLETRNIFFFGTTWDHSFPWTILCNVPATVQNVNISMYKIYI